MQGFLGKTLRHKIGVYYFVKTHGSGAVFCRLFMPKAQITKFDVMPSNSSHDQEHLFLTGACLIGYKCLPFKLLMLHL